MARSVDRRDDAALSIEFLRRALADANVDDLVAMYRFTGPEGGTAPRPNTAAELRVDATPLRGLPVVSAIVIDDAAFAGGKGCGLVGDFHRACFLHVERAASPALTVTVFMIGDQGGFVVDGLAVSPLSIAVVAVERIARSANFEDLVTTRLQAAKPPYTTIAVPGLAPTLANKARSIIPQGDLTVTPKPVTGSESVLECRAVRGQAELSCTVEARSQNGTTANITVSLVAVDGPSYRIADIASDRPL